ncbi:MAG: hypothetical protein ACRD96_11435, partial [Bryobacteraceae bacterium]
IRPVQSPEERRRVQGELDSRRRSAEEAVAKARNRTLTEQQKEAVARITSFLDQAAAAFTDDDLQQADALSSRAYLLSQDLMRDK